MRSCSLFLMIEGDKLYTSVPRCIEFREGRCAMRDFIRTKNCFRSTDNEKLKKAVTEKVGRLVSLRLKKSAERS